MGFMYKPYGRAVLYIFMGVLLISQSKVTFQATGLYLLIVGGLVIYYAGRAQEALDKFKNIKLSFSQLKRAYKDADKNNDGLTPLSWLRWCPNSKVFPCPRTRYTRQSPFLILITQEKYHTKNFRNGTISVRLALEQPYHDTHQYHVFDPAQIYYLRIRPFVG